MAPATSAAQSPCVVVGFRVLQSIPVPLLMTELQLCLDLSYELL